MTAVNQIEGFTNQNDLLITEIDPTGSIQLFSTYLGGNGNDSPAGIAVDSRRGRVYISDQAEIPSRSTARAEHF